MDDQAGVGNLPQHPHWRARALRVGGRADAATPGIAAEEVPRSQEQIALSFAPVVRKARRQWSTSTRKRGSRNPPPVPIGPVFRFFFEDFGGPLPRSVPENSLGSGVIVAADGLIVTNHHVIEDASEIMVVLSDRREFHAELIAPEQPADLALLDIEAENLPALPMGDSDLLEVGDLVLAIGNPFGIGQTVTSGIVSAVARSTPDGASDLSFIQTDAPIKPGNSGGALVDLAGALVGINTAILTRGGGSIGIGFAIRVNLVIRIVADEPIEEVAELKTILREQPLPWRLEVERAGRRLAVVIGG
jgi:S1-C subfamily serine protease